MPPKTLQLKLQASLEVLPQHLLHTKSNKKSEKISSYRRETALQGALVLAKSGRLEQGDIFYGHCRSIFNYCDIMGLLSYRIR